MIEIKWAGGRFGNVLFQYSFARLVAEKFGYKLVADLPANDILTNSPSPNGLEFDGEPLTICDVNRGGAYHMPSSLLRRRYVVHGFFQNIDYYSGNEERIRSFFRCDEQPIDEANIAAHVRLGDYKQFGPGGTVIHPSFYTEILNRSTFDKLYVVTDEPTDSRYMSQFKRYPHKIISGSAADDFKFMMRFKRIIIANSSFSWWAAMLGNAVEIHTFMPWLRNCTDYHEIWRVRGCRPHHGSFADY